MKILELLTEARVKSSWIARVDYTAGARILTLTLKNGRMYRIPNISQSFYNRMIADPSKGKYYHRFIKNRYLLTRIGNR